MEQLALFHALCRIANCLEALARTPEACAVREALLAGARGARRGDRCHGHRRR